MAARTQPSVAGSGGDGGHAEGRTPTGFDALYRNSWWPMLRLATGLVDDPSVAEDVVQDAFAAVYRRWNSIRDDRAAVSYVRMAVVNASRTALRRRITARRHGHRVEADVVESASVESADHQVLLDAEHESVRDALKNLPARQREVLTLRYIDELSDAEIAQATGLSEVGVRSASSRGLAALRSALGGRL